MFWFVLYLITALLAAIYITAEEAKKDDIGAGIAIVVFIFTLFLTPIALITKLLILASK